MASWAYVRQTMGDSHVDVTRAPDLTLTQRKHQRNRLLEEVRLAEGEQGHLSNLAQVDNQQV